MKTTRFSEARILAVLRQTEDAVPTAALCREYGSKAGQDLIPWFTLLPNPRQVLH